MSEDAQYIVVRKDLKLRRGKEIAQAVHAMAQLGYVEGLPLIVLQATSETHLLGMVEEAEWADVPCRYIRDAGRTEVTALTITAAAFGPVAKDKLQGLREAALY